MVHTGVLVKSTLGESNLPVYSLGDSNLDNVFAGGRVKTKLNYFNVPIMMKYKFNKRIYAEGRYNAIITCKNVRYFHRLGQ